MIKFITNFYSVTFIVIFIFILNSCTKGPTIKNIEKGIYKSEKSTFKGEKKITILPGDTLLYLSKKYKVTIKELIKFNSLKPPYILKPGKYLFLPPFKIHKISKGDTLFKIAKCYSVNTKDIYDKNLKLKEKKLKIGTKIKLPYYAKQKNCYTNSEKLNRQKKYKNIDGLNYKPLFIWPTKGKIIDTYGKKRGGRRNDGINILAPKGNPVRAALDGKVIYKGNEIPSWGNLIIIKHNKGWSTLYAHLDKFVINIGEHVNTGDVIGSVGNTGNVEKYQLHFQVRKSAKPVNPKEYIKLK